MKRNKGFTLIELLAVIVVLAIIALIAVPIILGVIEKAEKGAAKASILGYIDAVEKQVVIEMTNGNPIEDTEYTVGDGSLLITNTKYKGSEVTGSFELSNKQVISGNFCANGYSMDYDGKNTTYNKNANYCELTGKKISLSGDNNNDGKADVGDMITIRTKTGEEENFYVMSNDGNEIKSLAKMNLKVGGSRESGSYVPYSESEMTNLQIEGMNFNTKEGITAYSTTGTTYEGSIVEQYINEYAKSLPKIDGKEIKVSLITAEELEELGWCSRSSHSCRLANTPEFIWRQNFWTSTANGSLYLWGANDYGYFCGNCYSYDQVEFLGVRPVITISASSL